MKKVFMDKKCPRCTSQRVIPIVYGFPTKETDDSAMNGEIELGGCSVYGNDPTSFCTKCGKRFN